MLVRRRAELRRRPSQERSSFTFEAILDAAEQVILADGLGGLQMSALGRRAGVSAGTLYQYFPDRTSVAMALSDRIFHRFAEDLRRLVEAARGSALPVFLEQLAFTVIESALKDHPLRLALREVLDAAVVGERVDFTDAFASALAEQLQNRTSLTRETTFTASRLMVWTADGVLEGALRDADVSAGELGEALLAAWKGITASAGA